MRLHIGCGKERRNCHESLQGAKKSHTCGAFVLGLSLSSAQLNDEA